MRYTSFEIFDYRTTAIWRMMTVELKRSMD
nr:MAG TPA: hypothetical protein [Caudoviricetes sp.]